MYAVGSPVAWIRHHKIILNSLFLLLKSFYQQIIVSSTVKSFQTANTHRLPSSLRVQTTVILTRIISIAALQLVF